MVDRAGGENLAPLCEDTVHQGAAAAALILALDGNDIARPVRGIAAHGILAQVLGRDHHIQMRPCLPQGQIGPVGIAQFISRDAVAQHIRAGDGQRQYRTIRQGLERRDQPLRVSACDPRAVCVGGDHRAIGADAGLAVHRVGVGVGMRGKRRRVDGQRLVFRAQLQVFLQTAGVHRLVRGAVATVVLHLQIPPPFLDGVDVATVQQIVELGQRWRGGGQLHRGPAPHAVGQDPLKVPGAGLHAAPAHGTALGRDPVGGAFLAVGFPDLVAVEHQLRPRRDRPRGTFPRAFLAAFAEFLQAEVDRLVMGHRQGGRHRARFQTRAKIGVQDDFADAADLTQARQQQQRGLQHIAIHHRMRLGRISQIADQPRQHAAHKAEPQIGAHGLRHADPVIARSPLHRVETLIDHEADRLIMGRVDRGASGVVAVPRPIGASADAHGIGPQEIGNRLDHLCRLLRGEGGLRLGSLPVLQQTKGPKRAPLRHRGRRLADVAPAGGPVLQLFAHVPEQRTAEHIGALGQTRDARFVHIGRGAVHAFKLFKRLRAIDKASGCIGGRCAGQGSGGQRAVTGQIHRHGDGGQRKTRADKRSGQLTVLGQRQTRRDRQLVQIYIACRHRMPARRTPQQADVIRQYRRRFRGK